MGKNRLEAFSDGVFAIILTIMVLSFKTPHGSEWKDLLPVIPAFGSYTLSFIYVGIFWNNHHHLLQTCKTVNGKVLWANLFLLFWLSIVPFVSDWLDDRNFSGAPAALYGGVLLMSTLGYLTLQFAILSSHKESEFVLRNALGSDLKGKISIFLYLSGIGLSFWENWLSIALYITVALMWLIPDRRIEKYYR